MSALRDVWGCRALLVSTLLFTQLSCSRAAEPAASGQPSHADLESALRPAKGEFSVMSYNMMRFQFDDRDNDGQANEFKPQEEIDAVMSIVRSVSPDVLACIEMGDAIAFKRFQDELKKVGLVYPHAEHLMIPGSHTHLALVSRFPIVSRQNITNETYSIGTNTVPVQRGFLSVDVQVNDNYRFRIVTAHLKSKRFSTLGQTEMRRNEARLLNKNVRHFMDEQTNLNLLVVGDLNDTPKSAAIREAIGKPEVLVDLHPKDVYGDTWTHLFYPEESYERIDYALCSPAMAREAVSNKCHIVRDVLTYKASDHRPLVSVFRAQDL